MGVLGNIRWGMGFKVKWSIFRGVTEKGRLGKFSNISLWNFRKVGCCFFTAGNINLKALELRPFAAIFAIIK